MTGKIQQKIDFFDFPKTKKKIKKPSLCMFMRVIFDGFLTLKWCRKCVKRDVKTLILIEIFEWGHLSRKRISTSQKQIPRLLSFVTQF